MSKHHDKTEKPSNVPVPEREIIVFLAQHNGKVNGAILNRYAKTHWKISSTTLYKYLDMLKAGSLIRKSFPSFDDIQGGDNYELVGNNLHELSRLYLHLWELSKGHEEMFAGRLRNSSWYETRLNDALSKEKFLFSEIRKRVIQIDTKDSPDFFDSHVAPNLEALMGHKIGDDPNAKDERAIADVGDRFYKAHNGSPIPVVKMFLDTSGFSGFLFCETIKLLYEGPKNETEKSFFKKLMFDLRRNLDVDGVDQANFSDWDIGLSLCLVLGEIAKEQMGWIMITKKKLRELGLNLSVLMDSNPADK